MSKRAVAFIRRSAQRILSDNRQLVARKRLRGGLQSRLHACEIAADIVALTRMGTGIEWTHHDRRRNELTGELRKISLDLRTSAEGRIESIRRLCVLEGIMSETTLDDSPQDTYIKSLLKKPEPEPKPVIKVDYAALLKAAEERYYQQQQQGGVSQ